MAQRLPLIIFALVLAVIPLLPGIPPFWIVLLDNIGLASLVAMGLVLLTGVGGLTSFGQAAFCGFGAYTTAVLTTAYGVSPWLTLPASLVVSGIAAVLLGLVTVRLSGHYLPLGTIAWGIGLFYLFSKLEFLGRNDGALIGDVSQALDIMPSAMTGLADRMERAGLVKRRRDGEDGRSQRLHLTSAGQELGKRAATRTRVINNRLMDGFSEAEIDVVSRWLTSLQDKFPKDRDG